MPITKKYLRKWGFRVCKVFFRIIFYNYIKYKKNNSTTIVSLSPMKQKISLVIVVSSAMFNYCSMLQFINKRSKGYFNRLVAV